MTERQLRDGWKKCIENVENLLYGAKLLLSDDKSYRYAIGLYMFSVEEFGKALLLKKCFTQNKQKFHPVPKWIFGKEDSTELQKTINNKFKFQSAHDKKLEEGFNNLPSDCRQLSRGIKITNALESTRTFQSTKEPFIKKIKTSDKDALISIPKGVTGFFLDSVKGKDEIEPDLKTASFYMDWDTANNRWKFMIPTDPHQLRKNIKLFEQKVSEVFFE
jgi:AbiV family abortive infection protein